MLKHLHLFQSMLRKAKNFLYSKITSGALIRLGVLNVNMANLVHYQASKQDMNLCT